MRLAGRRDDPGRVEATRDLPDGQAIHPDPVEDLAYRRGLRQIDDILRRGAIELFAIVAIAIGRGRQHIDAAAVRRVALATPIPFHDLGAFIFRNHPLHLQ